VTDGQTDRQMDGRIDRQNYDYQDRASIAASCGKNTCIITPYRSTTYADVAYGYRLSSVVWLSVCLSQ